jgi:hypothetical protein
LPLNDSCCKHFKDNIAIKVNVRDNFHKLLKNVDIRGVNVDIFIMGQTSYKFHQYVVDILRFWLKPILYILKQQQQCVPIIVVNELTSVLFQAQILYYALSPHRSLIEYLWTVQHQFGQENPHTQHHILLNQLIVNWLHPGRSATVIKLPVHVVNHPQHINHAGVPVDIILLNLNVEHFLY